MKRIPLLLLIFIFSAPLLFSQGQYTVNFSNGKYLPERVTTYKKSSDELVEKLAAHKYQFIQFYKLPNKDEIRQLKDAGIIILDYLPSNAYAVSIDTGKLKQKSDVDFQNIRSFFTFPASYKIDKRLTSGKLPEWTEPEFGKVDLNVLFFEGYSEQKFMDYIQKWKPEILSTHSTFNRITIRINVQYLENIADYPAVKWIEPIEPPKEKINSDARKSQRNNVLTASGFNGARGLSGDGIVIGEWDGGKIGHHQDLYGRVDNNSTRQEDWHSTHVAGTILGRGILDPKGKGMAPNAELYASDFLKDGIEIADEMENAASEHSVDITSNSWGYSIDQFICDNPFPYISSVQYYDQVAYSNKKLTHVFANGNDQQVCPGGYWTSSWTMKNAILVGAIDDTSKMSNFSSLGPLFDGRMVPHVCAVGVDVYSTFLDNYYYHSDGTSMATPAVSGGISLLYEQFNKLHNTNPTSDLIRAVLFNSAEDLGREGPDYKYGFGRINLRKAVESLEEENYRQNNIINGETKSFNISVPANAEQVKVTLTWTDPAGTPFAGYPLVNDLDLEVSSDSETWLPWVLDKSNPRALATRGKDRVSNYEQVTISKPAEGNYTVKVKGHSIPALTGQDYSVAYQVEMQEVNVTYPIGGESINSGEPVYVRWDATDTTQTFDIDFSTDNGQSWTNLVSGLEGSRKYYKFTTPDTFTSEALIKVTQGTVNDQSDSTFSIIGVPDNFKATEQYQALDLHWDSVPGATSYEVFEAVDGELNQLGITSDTTFHIDGLETGVKNYVTVRARRDENGIVGERAKAIYPKPIPQYDFSVQLITEPTSGVNLTSSEHISAKILNSGANSLLAGDTLPVRYSINEGGEIQEEIILSETFARGDTLEYTFDQTAYMATHDNYKIKVWTAFPRDTFYTENDSKETIVTNSQPVTDFPYEETFDDFSGLRISSALDPVYLNDDWNNDHINDDIEWWPNSGTTYKDGTGPYADHTTGQGKYLYTEAYVLDGEPGDAFLFSPGFNISQLDRPTLYFWYHMFSKDSLMGDLHVDLLSVTNDTVYKDIMPSIKGTQGKEWHRQIIDLSSYKEEGIIRIRFRAEITDNWQNAFAIDDVTLSDLYQNNLGVIDMKPESGNEKLSASETVQISVINVGPDTLTSGTDIPVGYRFDDSPAVLENFTLEQPFAPFDTLTYSFSEKADLSDLTKRYEFEAWVDMADDQESENDSLTEYFLQSYCEPRSDCYSGGTPTGIGTFIMDGIHDQFDINNTNSLCGSTGSKGYSYHGDMKAKVYTGSDYQMQLRCIVPPPQYNIPIFGEYFKIWIDFDQSGSFEEDELVFENKQRDIDLLTDTIHIPEDATPGKTRIRIRSSYYQEELISPTQTCSPISHGETEDYSIEILPYPEVDLSMLELTQLPHTFTGLTNAEEIGIEFVSKGSHEVSSGLKIPFAYQVNEEEVIRDTLTLNQALQKEDIASFVFDESIDMSETGEYKIRLWNEQQSDQDPWNDTLYTRIHHMEQVNGENYAESFENGAAGWFDESDRWNPVWELGVPSQENIHRASEGDNAWMTHLDENYPDQQEMMLYSPAFDFSDMEKPLVSFYMYFRTEFNWDGMILEASTDGKNWEKVGSSENNFYNNTETNNPQWDLGVPWWSGNNAGWQKYEVTLGNYGGESNVLLRFRFKSDLYSNDEGIAIDKVSVVEKKTDIGITRYVGPKDPENLTDREYIEFEFANLGTTTFSNDEEISIDVEVNHARKDFTYQLTSDFLPGDTIVYETPSSFDMSEQSDYEIEIRVSHFQDEMTSNNEYSYTIENPATGLEAPRAETVQMDIYPNPSDGYLFVDLKAEVRDSYTVSVFNGMGAKCKEIDVQSTSDAHIKVDMSDLESGIYVVRVTNGKVHYTRKILLK